MSICISVRHGTAQDIERKNVFDTAHFRKAYETEIADFGRVISGVGIFDRRVLWPRTSIPEFIRRESKREISLADLDLMAEEGYFTWLAGAGADGTELGIPMYMPWRIALFAELESRGWTRAELREAAEWEEWVITECLTTDHLAYEDDDVRTLITRIRTMLEDVTNEIDIRAMANGGPPDRTGRSWNSREAAKSTAELLAEQQRHERMMVRLQETDITKATDSWRRVIEREAYITRHWQETMRVLLIQEDRARLDAGFNRTVCFTGSRQLLPTPDDLTAFGAIDWQQTLTSWPVREDPDHCPVRLPGFVLMGGKITLEPVLTPTEYSERYEIFSLAQYHEAFKSLMGERRCSNCQGLLKPGSHIRRRYCSDECSSAARQRRFRQNQKAEILRHRNSGGN